MTREIDGLVEIVERFDGIAVDQYGVLHDGQSAFPGARQVLKELAALGLPVVALTNSGKRAGPNLSRLARLGFPGSLFHGLISSGELARSHMERLLAAGDLAPGAPVRLFSRDDDTSILDGLDLRLAGQGDNASLVILAGVEPERRTLESYDDEMRPYAAAGVPALLVNPDRLMTTTAGPKFGPGRVADIYQSAGGTLTILGKPARQMFQAALDMLGCRDASRVLMIGDSPEHDIVGARDVGMATLIIRGGVQNSTPGPQADFGMSVLNWSADDTA